MPYKGQDWRSPGAAWVKTHDGWKPASQENMFMTSTNSTNTDNINSSRQEGAHTSRSPDIEEDNTGLKRDESNLSGGKSSPIDSPRDVGDRHLFYRLSLRGSNE